MGFGFALSVILKPLGCSSAHQTPLSVLRTNELKMTQVTVMSVSRFLMLLCASFCTAQVFSRSIPERGAAWLFARAQGAFVPPDQRVIKKAAGTSVQEMPQGPQGQVGRLHSSSILVSVSSQVPSGFEIVFGDILIWLDERGSG